LYAPTYLGVEIERHKNKIIEYTKYSEEEFTTVKAEIFRRIKFIDDDLIPFEEWISALRLVRGIDRDDVNFVALSNLLDKELWTGDAKLYAGLKAKGYRNIVNFADLRARYGL
jgi:predicted nucleic acid-binding protein